MQPILKRTRPLTCLSDYRLDQLVAGELDPRAEEESRAHLLGCANCAARLSAIEADRAAFLADPPPLRVPPRRVTRRLLTWAPRIAAPLALAAAVALWMRVQPPAVEPGDPAATRIKGKSRLGLYVKRGPAILPGASGDTVYPGDTLQFTTTVQREGVFVAVISVDGARKASVYYPGGPRAVKVEPGTDAALDQSTVLDDVLGPETAYGLFCDSPVELEPVRAAFEAAPEAPPIPAGCVVDRVSFTKRSAP